MSAIPTRRPIRMRIARWWRTVLARTALLDAAARFDALRRDGQLEEYEERYWLIEIARLRAELKRAEES